MDSQDSCQQGADPSVNMGKRHLRVGQQGVRWGGVVSKMSKSYWQAT